MPSDKARQGNRRNARLSTGPRTEGGKANASRNAVRWGVTARARVLPGEDAGALADLLAAYLTALKPGDAVEQLYVERILDNEVARRRAVAAERSLVATALRHRAAERTRRDEAPSGVPGDRCPEVLPSPEDAREADGRSLARLSELEVIRDSDESDLGVVYAELSDDLERLTRYRTAAERGIDRAVHELERRQAQRGGAAIPAPAVIDVTLDGAEELTR